MAETVFTDGFIKVNGVDLSSDCTGFTVSHSADMVEKTAFGDDTHLSIPGLKNSSISPNFNQNFAASKVDATLFPLVGATGFEVTVRALATTAVSATNPIYRMTAVLGGSYNPFGNSVGELNTVSGVEFVPFSGSLTRATAT